MDIRIGHSHDTHRLGPNRKLILGGVLIDYPFGLIGHSDGDVIFHVVSESIIGALGLGDLGTHFPDTDEKYKDINSNYFVIEAKKILLKCGYQISNLDLTVYLEKPILKPYKNQIRSNIANLLNISTNLVNVKATRGEGLGYIGRGEGISAECVVLIVKEQPILKKL